MSEIIIEQLREATPEAARDLEQLIHLLTSRTLAPMTTERLQHILESGTTVILARNEGQIIASILLCSTTQLVGTKYWIEDLVVDEAFRGQGLANQLMRAAIELVPDDAYNVNLTSNPSRTEARAWYERMGFEHKSNVYRLKR